ncbi:hypothetical protein LGL55_23010 [Clostridium tagluense]|uniref:hypothetical protein n=1 Tax=Clostridium tagluense TaxID=360422 RepID=UPI001CF34731|nr:hypothetical protein [Clostridium tagluense]MCB2313657.1 hypothetical protein [Clostridium tagluense]MCB2318787.1 hypothetical protein [Clostridium tagluense]MCB2323637.1 hypothetical protein [Clostridium tagluense]MCB2328512.1 hypothetical protein [Clostridium tagluense]MCB2333031.1 hypothetical protein [Clostridium tagluense]
MCINNTCYGYIQHKEDISLWKELVSYFSKNGTELRIDCWNDEKEIIGKLKYYANKVDIMSDMTIFSFNISDELVKSLVSLNDTKINYFSLFIKSSDNDIFSAEHYGKEIYMVKMNEKDVEFVKSIIPANCDFTTEI